jgi:hypothetical protein
MADNMELLLEAERRGLLPDDKKAALAEARKRGLVPMAPVPMDALKQPEPMMGDGQPLDQWGMLGGDLSNLAKGGIRGVEAAAQGGAQVAMRAPAISSFRAMTSAAGLPDNIGQVVQSVDDQAALSARQFSQSPAGQSVAGKFGEFVGATAATAPLAAASIPKKGAGVLEFLRKSAQAGAIGTLPAPVTGGDYLGEKTKQVLLGATVGAGVSGGLRGSMALAERVGYAPNALAQVSNVANKRANRTPYAQEGEELAERTGVRLTPGQVSGSRVQTALENMSRQSIFSADVAAMADEKLASDAIGFIDKAMDSITTNPASAATVGSKIQVASANAVGKITARREAVARQQFGPIEEALGDRKFVQYDNTRKSLDDLIAEYQAVQTPEARRIVKQAAELRDGLAQPQSLGDFQRQRSYYGKATQGKGTVFDEVDRTVNQSVARRIYAAMSDDLDASAAKLEGNLGAGIVPADYFKGQAQAGGNLAQALREANANYRRFSQLAEGVKAHPIARLFGKDIEVDGEDWFNTLPPEKVISRLDNMAPTEVRMVRQYMEGADPEAWQQYKRLLVQNALDEAQTLPASAGSRQVQFSAASFLRTLGGDKPAKLAQMKELFSAQEMRDIDDAFNVARRLGDRFGSNPSGTGAYNEVQSFLQSVKDRTGQALASTAGEALGLRKVANVMLEADGRRALMELSKLPPNSRRAAALLGYLSAVVAGQQTVYPDVQDN